MRLLLVDDDARMRQVLSRLLRENGFSIVEEAGDVPEAMERLAAGRFDVILTDLHLPGADGIALVSDLRARGDATPIIMVSGEHDPHQVVRAVQAGVNNYVPKPIHPETLFEKIWQTLGITPPKGDAEAATATGS